MKYQVGDVHNNQLSDPIFDDEIEAISASKMMAQEKDIVYPDGAFIGVWELEEEDSFQFGILPNLKWIVTLVHTNKWAIFQHSYTE